MKKPRDRPAVLTMFLDPALRRTKLKVASRFSTDNYERG